MSDPLPKPAAPLILIVGMHRSGTSLLGSLLQAAGVALPRPLIEGDRYNAEGYFERADITDLQEQLLIDLDRWWPSATGMEPLPDRWQERPEAKRAHQALREVLERESQLQQGPWAIKDPRSSLLLALWRRVCSELAIPLRLLLAVRDPAEVVSSLCERDAQAAGMTRERAERLWWHHNQSVLEQCDGLPLQVIHYSQWFSAGPGPGDQLKRMLRFCGLEAAAEDSALLERCLASVKPQHRRSKTDAAAIGLASSTVDLHRTLLRGDVNQARLIQPPPGGEKPSPPPYALKQRLRARLWQLRARRAHSADCDPGAWFDEQLYRSQWPGLAAGNRKALLHHYRQAGWRAGTPPHPLFDPGHYRQACRNAGLDIEGDPLAHWLHTGLEHGLSPSPLCDPEWLQQLPEAGRHLAALRLGDVHPWGAAAEALSAHRGQPEQARSLLHGWIASSQLTSAELSAIAALPKGAIHRPQPSDAPPRQERPPDGQQQLPQAPWNAVILGGSWDSWQAHAILQHLPSGLDLRGIRWCPGVPPAAAAGFQAGSMVLHLQSIERTSEQGLLLPLAKCLVFDPNPGQVQLLQRLGVSAQLISVTAPIHHPLEPEDASRASATLGLPSPAALAEAGTSSRPAVLCLGTAGPLWERHLDQSCWCLPGFHALSTHSVAQARQLAAWLQACQLEGVQLVELMPPSNPLPFDPFEALACPSPAPAGWMPVQRFTAEIIPAELEAELAWRREGCPPPPPCTTPTASHRCLWSCHSHQPAAAVCVSLHNYAERIETALESVRRQTLGPLELIVVDDASSDGGAAVVQAWFERHGQRFARAVLLQHTSNGGLAAARNTAFANAQAPWCFVLDADNQLLPPAVAQCLAIADNAPDSAAVIHPLVSLAYEKNDPYPRTLLSCHGWQQERFRSGNYVDAMALVRRSAWQQVGGYTHIAGGWEDFDFWCSLIDAGLHGVLCPQHLAVYTVHGSSMAATSTRRLERPLSRLLQHRHPWLQLPLAAEANPPTQKPPA